MGEDRTLSSRWLAASGDASFISTLIVSMPDLIFSPKREWYPWREFSLQILDCTSDSVNCVRPVAQIAFLEVEVPEEAPEYP